MRVGMTGVQLQSILKMIVRTKAVHQGRKQIAFAIFQQSHIPFRCSQEKIGIANKPEAPDEELKHHWDYIYEPDAKEVLDNLLVRYMESLVYQGVVENAACEQASRMVAMKSASDNAGDLIDDLQLVYNKARQAAITQEISEIVAGAAAV